MSSRYYKICLLIKLISIVFSIVIYIYYLLKQRIESDDIIESRFHSSMKIEGKIIKN